MSECKHANIVRSESFEMVCDECWLTVGGIANEVNQARINELEEDLRIANHNLDMVEKWQDKATEVYPGVAEHITRTLYALTLPEPKP